MQMPHIRIGLSSRFRLVGNQHVVYQAVSAANPQMKRTHLWLTNRVQYVIVPVTKH